jgi:hypothetical protein
MIFWQSPKTTKHARPGVNIPTARAHGQVLEVLIDSGEKYPYRFSGQQAITSRERLPCGDYAVQVGGNIAAVVERKTINDLISSMISGRMKFLLAELAAQPRAAVVVEEGYSKIFKHPYVTGSVAAERLAELQAQFPAVPIVFCELDRLPGNGPTAGLAPASMNWSSRLVPRRWRKLEVSDRNWSSPCGPSCRRDGKPLRSHCRSRLSLPAGPMGRP